MGIEIGPISSAASEFKKEKPEIAVRPASAPLHPEKALDGRVSHEIHPQIAWRIEELKGLRVNSFFDAITLLDHLEYFNRNNIPHHRMEIYPQLVSMLTSNKSKTLSNILYDKGLNASEKLFAASVYKRITGETFYHSLFYDELISGSNETTPEVKSEDFYSIPLTTGDVNKKLKEGIFTNNFALVREAIAQGADLNSQDVELNWTPLHYAIVVGNVAITYLLLQNGADPNIGPAKASDLDKWVEGKRKVFDPLNQGADKPLMKKLENRDLAPSKKLSPFALAMNKQHNTILLQLASAGAKFTQEEIDSVNNEETKRSLQNHFNLHLSRLLKNKKSDFATAIRSEAEEIVAKMNAKTVDIQSKINTDIRRVIQESPLNPDVIDQFRKDMDRNPALITYKDGKILTEGLFPGKYLIDHDFLIRKTSDLKAVRFLEANLHQGRIADAIGAVKGVALLLGTSKMFEQNDKTVFYDLNPSYTMDIEEGKNVSSFTLVVRAKFHQCLTEGQNKVVENYQNLFSIEQTYRIEDGVAVDFSCALI
ncbi:MAG: hypothetical protein ChlgKO_03780 [Chlamydiales bacterium]